MIAESTTVACPCGTVFPVEAETFGIGVFYRCPSCTKLVEVKQIVQRLVETPTAEPVPSPAPAEEGPSLWGVLGAAGLTIGAGWLLFKIARAIGDTDYGISYPRHVRERLRDEHLDQFGPVCQECGFMFFDRQDMTTDHRLAVANGGRATEWAAQILCTSCNSRKGSKNSALEQLYWS